MRNIPMVVDVNMICRLVHREETNLLDQELNTNGTYDLGSGDFIHYGDNGVAVELSNGVNQTHPLYVNGQKRSLMEIKDAVIDDLKSSNRLSIVFE